MRHNNLLTDLEYMRINAERERIKKYQDITKGSAFTYYNILKRLTEEYEHYKKDIVKGHSQPVDKTPITSPSNANESKTMSGTKKEA